MNQLGTDDRRNRTTKLGDSHRLQSSWIAAGWEADTGDLLRRQQSRSRTIDTKWQLSALYRITVASNARVPKTNRPKTNIENPKTRMKQQELLEPDCYSYMPVESQEWMGMDWINGDPYNQRGEPTMGTYTR
jgi:hypothetical protein